MFCANRRLPFDSFWFRLKWCVLKLVQSWQSSTNRLCWDVSVCGGRKLTIFHKQTLLLRGSCLWRYKDHNFPRIDIIAEMYLSVDVQRSQSYTNRHYCCDVPVYWRYKDHFLPRIDNIAEMYLSVEVQRSKSSTNRHYCWDVHLICLWRYKVHNRSRIDIIVEMYLSVEVQTHHLPEIDTIAEMYLSLEVQSSQSPKNIPYLSVVSVCGGTIYQQIMPTSTARLRSLR